MQNPLGLRHGKFGAVESQSNPRCKSLMVCHHRVVILTAKTHTQTAVVLPLTAARHHSVNVHGIDLTGEPGPSGVVACSPLGEEDNHDGVTILLVGREDHSGAGCGEPGVKPVVPDADRVLSLQWKLICQLSHGMHRRADRHWRRRLGSF